MADRMNLQQVMQRLGGEAIFSRLIEAIETIGLATDETGQKGKAVLTISSFKLKNTEKGDGFIGFETRLVTTPPSPSARSTGLYVDERGLHVDDPSQTRMDLRPVPASEAEARPVAEAAPVIREA